MEFDFFILQNSLTIYDINISPPQVCQSECNKLSALPGWSVLYWLWSCTARWTVWHRMVVSRRNDCTPTYRQTMFGWPPVSSGLLPLHSIITLIIILKKNIQQRHCVLSFCHITSWLCTSYWKERFSVTLYNSFIQLFITMFKHIHVHVPNTGHVIIYWGVLRVYCILW